MKEIIEILNATSDERIVGYGILLIVLIGVTTTGIAEIVDAFRKK